MIEITSGTGVGQVREISSNTVNQLNLTSAWGVVPDATSQFIIYQGYTIDGIHPSQVGHNAMALVLKQGILSS